MRFAVILALVTAAASSAHAQSRLPDILSPEFERRTFEPRRQPLAEPVPQEPAVEPVTPAPIEGPAFVLGGIRLQGATALGEAELAPLWAPLLGAEVGLGTLDEVASRITAAYRVAGFVLSQAVVPAQTIGADGIVRIDVIEGFVGQVDVVGGNASSEAIAERLLAPAAAERPLQLATLERGVLLARDTLRGSVDTVLQPSPSEFGAADLTVVLEPKPFDGFALIDNTASRLLGPWVARAGAGATNVLGLGERVELQGAAALGDPRLWYGQGSIGAPLPFLDGTWLDGGTVSLGGSVIRAKPDLEEVLTTGFSSVQDESNVGIELDVPFRRSRESNLYGTLALGWRESTSETVFGGDRLGSTTDRLLVLAPSLSFDRADRFGGVTLVDLELRQGIPIDGTTQIGSSGPANPVDDFTAISGTLQRLQRLGSNGWSVLGEVVWQYGFSFLPISERFALGGEFLGRGYAPGNTTGDSGYGGRLELRRLIDVPPIAGRDLGVLVYGWGDWGMAIDRSGDRDGNQWEQLGSIGVGARIDVTSALTLTPQIARQVVGAPVDTSNPSLETRFLIGAVARF